MRKFFVLFSVLFVLGTIQVLGNGMSVNDEKKPIPIKQGSPIDHFESEPRTLIPILCFYENEDLNFTFSVDVGEVAISVTNQTTGATQTTMFDSAFGQTVVNIGNTNASYLIYIVTEDGTTYWGMLQF